MNERVIPGATYRLQFNAEFTFADATRIVPYLHQLGITHCYASPIFEAMPGSTHGYDVCRFDRLNAILGSEKDFEQFVSTLRENGMGLILDMVPNHMAADIANPWWRDLLKNGPASGFANYFDIKWKPLNAELRGKILLPVLEDELEKVLQDVKIRLVCDLGEFIIAYHEKRFPIAPESEPAAKSGDLAGLLEQQHYRLAHWRAASTDINYRRFFDVTGLVSLKMERSEVFEAAHALVLRLIAEDKVSGLRIDHPDGLWDPKDYFDQLREASTSAIYIVAEKILTGEEKLPEDWAVEGTTGYDFLNAVNGLFVDSRHEEPFTEIYRHFTGQERAFSETAYKAKKRIVEKSFAGELDALAEALTRIAAQVGAARGSMLAESRRGLREVVACFPVYRVYATGDAGELSTGQCSYVETAIEQARLRAPELARAVFDLIGRLLMVKFPKRIDETTRNECTEFVMRLQQLTGPVAAKGIEDTALYRYNRLISLNEVGGNPARFGVSVPEFHAFNQRQLKHWPHSLLATSTHDTKRGEDVRAAINVLSEIPADWERAVSRWSELNASKKQVVSGKAAPDTNDEYFFYQTLIGAWPDAGIKALKEFRERMVAYMGKAIKEAKLHTSWTDPNADYEHATERFVEAVLDPANQPFLDEFSRFQAQVAFFGRLNSLSQLLLKITSPGVPDFYQGTELWDLNLVDPDNRRPVDYRPRQTLLEQLAQERAGSNLRARPRPSSSSSCSIRTSEDEDAGRARSALFVIGESDFDSARLKMFVTRWALQFRNAHRNLFDQGEYLPLEVAGPKKEHVIAFARVLESEAAIVVVPRLCWSLLNGARKLPLGDEVWEETRVVIPLPLTAARLANVFTDEQLDQDAHRRAIRVAELLNSLPLAIWSFS